MVTPILEGLDPLHLADTPAIGSTLTPRPGTKSPYSAHLPGFSLFRFRLHDTDGYEFIGVTLRASTEGCDANAVERRRLRADATDATGRLRA